jgi:excisionase family DNA binding protein
MGTSRLEFEQLLDDTEASALLGLHPKTLQKLARVGQVPAYRVGRFWRYRASDLEMWLRSGANSDRQPVDRVDFTQEKTCTSLKISRLTDVKTVDVEKWLRGLALASATKAKIRNVMHVIFSHACRYEWLNKNPMSLVRQSAKREKLADVLELSELKRLLVELQDPARLLVFLTAATGLRVSEALGLKWSDVDFSSGELRLTRAIVHQHVGKMKTEASQNPFRLTEHCLKPWQTGADEHSTGNLMIGYLPVRSWTADSRTGQSPS